jgi:ubiquinol-cytochrome c reductase cytochrome b subunit
LSFLTLIHLIFLHKEGSRNRIGLNRNIDKIQFHPYFTVKDTIFIMLVLVVSAVISFFAPYALGDAVNNVPANAIQTPVHIQPE